MRLEGCHFIIWAICFMQASRNEFMKLQRHLMSTSWLFDTRCRWCASPSSLWAVVRANIFILKLANILLLYLISPVIILQTYSWFFRLKWIHKAFPINPQLMNASPVNHINPEKGPFGKPLHWYGSVEVEVTSAAEIGPPKMFPKPRVMESIPKAENSNSWSAAKW